MTSVCAALSWVTSQGAMVFAQTPQDPLSGASLAPTGRGRVQNASSSAQAQTSTRITPQVSAAGKPTTTSQSPPALMVAIVVAMALLDQNAAITDAVYSRPSSTISSPILAATSAATTAGSVASSTATLSSTTPESKPSVGAIVGGVIGGLAGLLFVLAALWFLIFRKRKSIAKGSHNAHQQSPPAIQSPSVQEAQGSYMEDYKRSELEAGYVAKAAGRPELEAYNQPDLRIPAGKAELV
ncbi:MAG: hypothetical protein Q9171_001683 [Xanthocarpia ochracea]